MTFLPLSWPWSGRLVSFDNCSFGADSEWDKEWAAKEAFSSTSLTGWGSKAVGASLPQLIYLTFPEKRKIERISFMSRRDCTRKNYHTHGYMGAPTEFEIRATNFPDPKKSLRELHLIGNVLAHKKNVIWKGCASVLITEIPFENRNFYHSYGILVFASNRRDTSQTAIASIKMWEPSWKYCFP